MSNKNVNLAARYSRYITFPHVLPSWNDEEFRDMLCDAISDSRLDGSNVVSARICDNEITDTSRIEIECEKHAPVADRKGRRRLKCEYCGCIANKDYGTCEHCGAVLRESEVIEAI